MLKYIFELTERFFDETDESTYEESKLVIDPNDRSDAPIHNLDLTTSESANLRQLFSIPLSVNVKHFDFLKLVAMQE